MSENNGELPKIFSVLPDEIRDMHPHGQWLLDQPGMVINFATETVTLPLKAGHYALICNLPGHYAAGQHADFTVR